MPQSVLVIDDSADIHRLLRVRLKDEDIVLHSAMDGQEGMDAVRRLRPDLILLDVMMPGLGGFEVCRRLKADPALAPIPIIFLTGASDSLNKVEGLDLGAVDYVVKPFDVAELRARVRAALRTVRYQKLLEQRAQIDGLTGLWNRAYFDRRLEEVLAGCARHDRCASLCMTDVDHFKRVNDTCGHPFGDRVLEYAAEVIRATVRLSDVPCRYGGEEFAIILPDADPEAGAALAERLRAQLPVREWRRKDEVFHVTASFGVAGSVDACGAPLTAEQLVARADQALYQAKRAGRNCVRVFAGDRVTAPDAAPSAAATA